VEFSIQFAFALVPIVPIMMNFNMLQFIHEFQRVAW
jgi:hypothetical protein